jgi:hypothetical protein
LVTAVGLVATGLFFGYVRQGLLVLPLWLTLTAAAGVGLVRLLTRRGEGWKLPAPEQSGPSPKLLEVLGALVLSLLILELWGARSDREYRPTGATLKGTNVIIPDEPVRLELLPPEK